MAGAADHVASAYAAGVVAEGDVLLKFGGAGDILIAVDQARPDARLFLDRHVIPGRFMPNGCMAATGAMLNWIVAGFAAGAVAGVPNPHAYLDGLAKDIAPGSEGVFLLPYFLGEKSPIQDPLARGTISGLSLNHGPGHLWRAALEGVGYAFLHHIEVFRELGYPVRRLLASDGGSRSRVWMQIVADIIQLPVQRLEGHRVPAWALPGSPRSERAPAPIGRVRAPWYVTVRRSCPILFMPKPMPRAIGNSARSPAARALVRRGWGSRGTVKLRGLPWRAYLGGGRAKCWPSLHCRSDPRCSVVVIPVPAASAHNRGHDDGAWYLDDTRDDPSVGPEILSGIRPPHASTSVAPEREMAFGRGRHHHRQHEALALAYG